jgi:hypothetical protein
MAGFNPAIQPARVCALEEFFNLLDGRVKPAHGGKNL